MIGLINFIYSALRRAIWVIASLSTMVLVSEPITNLINRESNKTFNKIDMLYNCVWILTVVAGVYCFAKMVSNIICVKEPFIVKQKEVDLKSPEN